MRWSLRSRDSLEKNLETCAQVAIELFASMFFHVFISVVIVLIVEHAVEPIVFRLEVLLPENRLVKAFWHHLDSFVGCSHLLKPLQTQLMV